MRVLKHALCACILISLLGCNGPIGAGVGLGRRPIPQYIATIEFTNDERASLNATLTDPAVKTKIIALHADYVALLAERREETSEAIDVNGRQLVSISGYTHAEAISMIRSMLLMRGWPANDPLIVSLSSRDFSIK